MIPAGLSELVEATKATEANELEADAPKERQAAVELMVKRVASFVKRLDGLTPDDKTIAEVAHMNRAQRRATLSRVKHAK